jgi:hypothetical protein
MVTDTHLPYVFEIIDPTTRCIVYPMEVHDLERFYKAIQRDPAEMEDGMSYELASAEVVRIVAALGIPCEAEGREGLLRPSVGTDQLPYKVHTGRELQMMLEGTKPLAVFSDSYPSSRPSYDNIPEDVFAPHVESGRFVSREVIVPPEYPAREPPMRIVCYALATEQWRIDAYLLLHRVGFKYGWSETCERMEGTLLGYTDEQNDTYIEMIYLKHIRPSSSDR